MLRVVKLFVILMLYMPTEQKLNSVIEKPGYDVKTGESKTDLAEERKAGIARTAEQVQETKTVKKGAFEKLERAIDEKDLKNPAIARILLNSIDTLTAEKLELESYRGKFYEADKRCAVLEQKSSGESRFQILNIASFGIGGVVFGVSFATQGIIEWILFSCGLLLLLLGVILSFFSINKK